MYRKIFNDANNKIKMDSQLKAQIISEMECELDKKIGRRPGRLIATAVAVSMAVIMTGTTVAALSIGWLDGLNGLLDNRDGQRINITTPEEENPNYMGINQLADLGRKVDITAENNGATVQLLQIAADKYSVYGMMKITAPADFVFNTAHNGKFNAFDIGLAVEPLFATDSATGEVIILIDSESSECYLMPDDNDSDNSICFAFCIDTCNLPDNCEIPDNQFAGKTISIHSFSNLCECDACYDVSSKTEKLLQSENIMLKLPDDIAALTNEVCINGNYEAKVNGSFAGNIDIYPPSPEEADVTVSNISITPFSIRYNHIGNSDIFYASPTIVFKNGERLYLTTVSMLTGDQSVNSSMLAANFPAVVNTGEISAVIIGNTTIPVK